MNTRYTCYAKHGQVGIAVGDIIRVKFGSRGSQLAYVGRITADSGGVIHSMGVEKYRAVRGTFNNRVTVYPGQVLALETLADLPSKERAAFTTLLRIKQEAAMSRAGAA